ncbi:unnamed protein product [Camellia sinensis]
MILGGEEGTTRALCIVCCGCFWTFIGDEAFASRLADPNSRRSCIFSLFPTASLLCLLFFIGSAFLARDPKEKLFRWGLAVESANQCKSQCRPPGTESLPTGIVSKTSNLEMRPLWGSPKKKGNSSNLFTVAVGIKQKAMVDKLVRKFLSSDFVVMLFHYDGIVDKWKDLKWSDRMMMMMMMMASMAKSRWFAKRFLHPDIVAEYDYIFLWDEDLGVEDFHPERYLEIVKNEGLEISQPALDSVKSEVHHQITARGRRSNVHSGGFTSLLMVQIDVMGKVQLLHALEESGIKGKSVPQVDRGYGSCVLKSCLELCMVYDPNDLIHAWGLDIQLGYCAQGDRTKNIGVVDAEYVVHYGLPTLGDPRKKNNFRRDDNTSEIKDIPTVKTHALSKSRAIDYRVEVRRQSYNEFKVFKKRWVKAAENDECWIDPYPEPQPETEPVKQRT